MFCEKCGSSLLQGSKFCGRCGGKIDTQATNTATHRKSTAPPQRSTVPPQSPSAMSSDTWAQTPPTYREQPGVEAMSVKQYIVTLVLMMIPILGIILLFKWSFSGSVNMNKKNMARAYLIFFAVWLIILLVGGGAIMGLLKAMIR